MADMTAIAGALTSIQTVLALLKNANDGHLAMQISAEIANVQSKLIDVQQQALTLLDSNQKLRAELDKYKTVSQHHSVIWRKRDDGSEDGPFCPVCSGEGREMRLILRAHGNQEGDVWRLHCAKNHASPGAVRDLARGMEQVYVIPKSLVPDNYFVQIN
jgi:hypothetical protein